MTTKQILHIAVSQLSNTIFAGSVLKSGNVWAANKQDVTTEALVAVAQHVVAFGKPVEISCNGALEFRITVEKFEPTYKGTD